MISSIRYAEEIRTFEGKKHYKIEFPSDIAIKWPMGKRVKDPYYRWTDSKEEALRIILVMLGCKYLYKEIKEEPYLSKIVKEVSKKKTRQEELFRETINKQRTIMDKNEVLIKLASVADSLDEKGAYKEANEVEDVMKQVAGIEVVETEEDKEEKTEE